METLKLIIPCSMAISGLLIAGAEVDPLKYQVILNTAGMVIFALGGLLLNWVCRKAF